MWKSVLPALVLIAVASLGIELFRTSLSAQAQLPSGQPASSEIIVHSNKTEDGGQQVIVFDTNSRVMAVYHVDGVSGKISLRSVRNLNWDLRIEEFNGGSPSPREIRTLLDQP